jgi:hypothetical protein
MSKAALVWTEVDSSNVHKVAYHDKTQTLCVEFIHGGLYVYKHVDHEVYVDFVHAESVGKYLNTTIKPYHEYEKFSNEAALLTEIDH